MPTANELLNSLTESKVITVNNNLRTIVIPPSISVLGVESDDDVLRLEFSIPRFYSEQDLSDFQFRINYINAQNEGDVYVVDDVTTSDDSIEFSWLVGGTALKYAGKVSFILCLKKVLSDGTVEREYNTTVATLPVLEGLETEEQAVQDYPDVLENMLLHIREYDQKIIEQDKKIEESLESIKHTTEEGLESIKHTTEESLVLDKLKSSEYYDDMRIEPSDESLFNFTLDGNGYRVSAAWNPDDESITRIVIPYQHNGKPVTGIVNKGFQNYSHLKTVVIPKCCHTLGPYSFSGCSDLTDVTFPDIEMYIYSNAFEGCDLSIDFVVPRMSIYVPCTGLFENANVKSVVIPEHITFVDTNTFKNCTSLKSITFLNLMFDGGIYIDAFKGCDNLSDVYYVGTKEQWDKLISEEYSDMTGNEALLNATIHYNWIPAMKSSVADNNLTNVTDQGLVNITEREFISNKTQTITFDNVITITEDMVGGIITDFEFKDKNTGNRYTYLEEKDKVVGYRLQFYREVGDRTFITTAKVGDIISDSKVGYELMASVLESGVTYDGIEDDCFANSIVVEKSTPIIDKIATEHHVSELFNTLKQAIIALGGTI